MDQERRSQREMMQENEKQARTTYTNAQAKAAMSRRDSKASKLRVELTDPLSLIHILVALCSVGPILAVLLLGLLYHPGGSGYEQTMIVKTNNSVEMWQLFQEGLPYYMKEMLISLLPIILFFFIFQIRCV